MDDESALEPFKGNRNRKGRGPSRFYYTYPDLAELFGMTQVAVRSAVYNDRFNPNSLRSVIAYYNGRKSQPPQATPAPPAPQSPPSVPEIAWSSNISNANPLSPEAERRVQQAREYVAKQREKAEFFSR